MVLMVDDERRQMDSYYLDLERRGIQVQFETDVDVVLETIKAGPKPDLVILDVMMPPGRLADTELGLRTGVRLFENMRVQEPQLPVMVFTNVTDPKVEDRFDRESMCWFMRKADFLPAEFTAQVKQVLGSLGKGA